MKYSKKKIHFEIIEQESFLDSEPFIYEIIKEGVKFEFLVSHRSGSNQTVVFGTADFDKNVKKSPVFDRHSWYPDLSCSGIWYFDPSTYLDEASLCWGYGTNQRWYLQEIAEILRIILRKWEVGIQDTVFFGSSGSGFTSILLATMFRGKAAVINPQFIVLNFWPRKVQQFRQAVLKPGEELIEERIDAVKLFKKTGYIPSVRIVQNLQAKRDVETQINPFLMELADSGLNAAHTVFLEFYSNPGGHGAMPSKEETLRLINEQLNAPIPEANSGSVGDNKASTALTSGSISAGPVNTSLSDKKLYFVITVDTEDKYENVPNLYECDFGDEGNCGVHYIMDQLEKRGMRGVFFTNIYEHQNFTGIWEGYIERLIREMSDRGHEVALHTHQDGSTLPFYQEQLFACNYEEQKQILEYGAQFIEKHTGKRPVSHRGGGYRCNDITFRVLAELGFQVDSSCFAHNTYSPNRNLYYRSLNQICTIDDILEFPVIAILDRQGRTKKFDVNQLSLKELINSVEEMKRRPDFTAVQFMFHSFSFLDQRGSDELEPSFVAGRHAGYGVSRGLTTLFESFLDYLQNDPQIEVVTFDQYLSKNNPLPSFWGDGVFSVDTEEAKKAAKEFQVQRVNRNYYSQTTYRDTELKMRDFNQCAIPEPHSYFGQNAGMEAAAAFMNHELRVYPAIEPISFEMDSFDWNIRHSRIPNTFLLYLHALTPVQYLSKAYLQTENVAYLKSAFSFINNWWQYVLTQYRKEDNSYVWYDHSTALRAENLIYFGMVCSAKGFWSDEIFTPLYEILKIHGDWLFDDQNYTKKHNHGVMQDQALLHLGVLFQNESWIKRGIERLKEQFKAAFNSENVHNENSPGYVLHGIGLFEGIAEFLTSNRHPYGPELKMAIQKAKDYYHWTVKPNGIVVQVGDTNNPVDRIRESPERCTRTFSDTKRLFPASGIYFYRSDIDAEPTMDTWKTVHCGYVSTAHKHADDASFVLYGKGYELLSDCGIYGYAKDAFRDYFISSKAHNTIVVDEGSYPCDWKHAEAVNLCAYSLGEQFDHIRMENTAFEGVFWRRDFYSADDVTVLRDSLSSDEEHSYSQVFHLSEWLVVESAEDSEVVVRIADSGYRLRIRQVGDRTRLSVIAGKKDHAGYGLISRRENHVAEITTLKFDLNNSNCELLTIITIEDGNGVVRVFDKLVLRERIIPDRVNGLIRLGDCAIPLDGELVQNKAQIQERSAFLSNDALFGNVVSAYSYRMTDSEILFTLKLNPNLKRNYQFAYYLMENDEAVYKRSSYSGDLTVYIPIDHPSEAYRVKYFLKTGGRNKSFLSEPLSTSGTVKV